MKLSNNQMILFAMSSVFLTSMTASGQIADNSKRNNPYSPSPEGKYIDKQRTATPSQNAPVEGIFVSQSPHVQTTGDRQLVARRSMRVVNKTDPDPLPPSEVYKVGIGDTLFIDLKNSPQGSRYCTVRADGTIDFPLAGENIIAAGHTVDAIRDMLAAGVTLFPDPQIEVKVREFGSHTITVSGSVENGGEKNLQREAMPLYAIISEAVVSPQATKAVIKRAPLVKLESYDLDDPATDSVLIYPGNSVEFVSDITPRSFYLTGEVNSTGKKELTAGLTLYHAIVMAGGTKGNPKNATIRRRNESGLFLNTDFDLRSIKAGRSIDPGLESGDIVEIRR